MTYSNPRERIEADIAAIREQLSVNLSYFNTYQRTTVEILQSHIEDHLKSIERVLWLLEKPESEIHEAARRVR